MKESFASDLQVDHGGWIYRFCTRIQFRISTKLLICYPIWPYLPIFYPA